MDGGGRRHAQSRLAGCVAGNPDKMEGRLVPPRGIDLVPLHFQGVRGRGAAAMLKLPFLLLRACAQAWGHLKRARPDVVLGMGGYVARSEEHTSELQSLMRISYAVFSLKKQNKKQQQNK